jgi:DNA transposition AAA+ family ATPase
MRQEIINQIVEKIKIDRGRFATDARHAHYLGMSAPIYSQVINGNTANKLDESRWRNIAYMLGVDWNADTSWKIVKTPTYEYIYVQLTACQERGISGILCDVPNIGKTVTAKHYAQQSSNVAYIDCSRFKTKDRLVREISRQFGIPNSGSYYTVLDQLIFNILAIDRPLIILDEAGDLGYEAFLEVKALWNSTENKCGWYMMGAEGLQKKIERRIDGKRVGYAELFSRFGDDFRRVTPEVKEELDKFLLHQARMIAQANRKEGQNADQLARKGNNSARRVRDLIRKPEAPHAQ